MILGTRTLVNLVLAIILAGSLEVAELVLVNNAAGDTGAVAELSADLRAGGLGAGAVHVGGLAAVGDVVLGSHRRVGEGEHGGQGEGLELHFL